MEILDSYTCRLPRPVVNISDSFWYVEMPSYTFLRTAPQSWMYSINGYRSTDILLPVHYRYVNVWRVYKLQGRPVYLYITYIIILIHDKDCTLGKLLVL